jgi:predicted metalloprotease with PDZ domain
MIHYRIEVADAAAHQFRVTLTVNAPAAETFLTLPVWIPGSYLVREFARHVSALEAKQGDAVRALHALSKNRWRVACDGREALVVTYLVYAFDASVRTAWLDAGRGFFNGTSLCLAAEGREDQPHRIELDGLPEGWEIATGMRAVGAQRPRARSRVFESASYDELVDHPFELGPFWRGRFLVRGVPHELVVSGAWPNFDGTRLLADTQRIVEAQVAFWHEDGPPPYERYVFMLHAVEDGYGGLEHRASTALIAARRDLPRVGVAGKNDGYVTLLGLISHEFFHTWNVKRLKPASFLPYDYQQENYTGLLWFFEGFTSYYDDQFLLRTGLLEPSRYLKLLARTINGVNATPGQLVQSVAEASFDAWVKYYRADENTPNATVSYYTKGSLIALLLDLALREKGRSSLDEVMRALWREAPGGGVDEALILAVVKRLGGRAVAEALRRWVHDRAALDVAPALARVAIESEVETLTLQQELGLRVSEGPVTGIQVKTVLAGGVAAEAGVSSGDELLAVDSLRVRRLDDAAGWVRPGAAMDWLVVRGQRVLALHVPARDAAERARVTPVNLRAAVKASAAAVERRRAWLGQ